MDQPLDIRSDGPVQIWTINGPRSGNAITSTEFIDAFDDAVDAANADFAVKAVILTGAGKIFSAGGNVKDMAERRHIFGADERAQRSLYMSGVQRIPRAIRRLEVALIGAVNGPAVGAGCDLAMLCDLRVASERASFAESFVRLGLIPGDGGSWILPRVVGWERAAEMTLTGDTVDARTAHHWGLVGRVVPHQELLECARSLANKVAANPAHALRMAKRLLLESADSTLESALAIAAAMQPLAHLDPEHQSRVAKWAPG